MYVHLTNYAINKNNSKFKQNLGGVRRDSDEEEDGSEAESGHKRSLNAILKILMQEGGDPDKILGEIKDIVVKTVMIGQPYMSHIYKSCQPEDLDNAMCF
jgi:tubulin polyglutamylase TTLL6/13